jgi:hypothetical protein
MTTNDTYEVKTREDYLCSIKNRINNNNKNRTITVTFRIDEKVMTLLQSQAKEQGVSLNQLTNQVLKRYIEWEMFASQVDMMLIAKPVLSELFRKMSKEEVIDLATRVGNKTIADIIVFMSHTTDFTSEYFLHWLKLRLEPCAHVRYGYEANNKNNGIQRCIIKHDLGYNWTLYHMILIQKVFEDMLHKRIDFTVVSDTILAFRYELYDSIYQPQRQQYYEYPPLQK